VLRRIYTGRLYRRHSAVTLTLRATTWIFAAVSAPTATVTASDEKFAETTPVTPPEAPESTPRSRFAPWRRAVLSGALIWLAAHLAYLTVMVLLVMINNKQVTLQQEWLSWRRWDTEWFVEITQSGYTGLPADRISPATAFFPLFPLLAWLINPIVPGGAFAAVMVVGNLAFLAALILLYRMFEYESEPVGGVPAGGAEGGRFGGNWFGGGPASGETASVLGLRGAWYLAIFPTGFFLAAGYNVSLAIVLSVAALYALRRHSWWLAGVFGALASANRSSGVLLLVPFAYEYLSAHGFAWRKIRPDVLFAALVPAGLGAYMIYTWVALDDPLRFMHAQDNWKRTLSWPWVSIWESAKMAADHLTRLTAFQIHNLIDLLAVLLVGGLLALSFVGPWRLRRDQWALPLYGIAGLIFITIFPDFSSEHPAPLKSAARLVLEVFPAFLILARLGRHPAVDKIYTFLAIAAQGLLLLVFLKGEWVA